MKPPRPPHDHLDPLPRMRYWQGDLGPPARDAEDRLTFDLEQPEYARQMAALLALANHATPHDLAALEDLANVGLVLSGVNLKRKQRTFRLSALGRIIAYRVKAGR